MEGDVNVIGADFIRLLQWWIKEPIQGDMFHGWHYATMHQGAVFFPIWPMLPT
jgi:hypothetical protein